MATHPVERSQVKTQGHRLVLPQGCLGRLDADIRITISIASDPAAEPQEVRQLERGIGKSLPQGVAQPALDLRRQIEESGLEVVKPVPHFIEDPGPIVAGFLRFPQRLELFAKALDGGGSFVGRGGFEVEPLQQISEAMKLRQDGATLGLGRMRRENRHDQETVEDPLNVFGS